MLITVRGELQRPSRPSSAAQRPLATCTSWRKTNVVGSCACSVSVANFDQPAPDPIARDPRASGVGHLTGQRPYQPSGSCLEASLRFFSLRTTSFARSITTITTNPTATTSRRIREASRTIKIPRIASKARKLYAHIAFLLVPAPLGASFDDLSMPESSQRRHQPTLLA
jgi:hypothetical protein